MIRYLLCHAIGVRANIAIRICLGVIQVFLGLAVVWICKRFIDIAVSGGEVFGLAITLIGITLLSVGVRQVDYYIGNIGNARMVNALRLRLQSIILRRKVFEGKQYPSGDLTARLEQDVPIVCEFITKHIPQTATTGIQLLGAFAMMRYMNPLVAWSLLVGTPLILVCGKTFGKRIKGMTARIRDLEADILAHLQEWNENTVFIECSGNWKWLIKRMQGRQRILLSEVKHRAAYTSLGRSLISGCFGLAYIGIFIWGGHLLSIGAITFGTMTSFLQLAGQIQQPIVGLMNMIPSIYHTSASIDRLREIENLPIECGTRKSQTEPLPLSFRDVTFSYTDNPSHMVKLNHTFMPGTTTAIIGESGVGKTTILRLMLGLVKPTSGEILFGGEPIQESMRANFVYIPQGNTLMQGTIRENLLLGNPDASEPELWSALHTAVADFVNDMDSVCQEKGGGLSEGMAQRIAIARGLLQPGSIMLFDEVSSALDADTERELFERLTTRFPMKTMIFVTHSKQLVGMCQNLIRL